MKFKYYYADTDKQFSFYSSLLEYVSEDRQERIRKLRFDRDKIMSLFSELVMRSEISQSCSIGFKEIEFSFGQYGKPYLSGFDNYHFSLSNAGNLIVFVQDGNPVGIDAEPVKTADMEIADHYFATDEYEYIIKSNDRNNAFYEIWTAKEAYLKMLGFGLSVPLDSFSVLSENIRENLMSVKLGDYYVSVCTEKTCLQKLEAEKTVFYKSVKKIFDK